MNQFHLNKSNFYSKWPIVGLLLVLLFRFGIYPGWNQCKSDFPNYYVGAQLLLKGRLADAYDIQKFDQAIQEVMPAVKGLFVMYPPATALVMIPLTSFDILSAKRIWILISLLLFFHSIRLAQLMLKEEYVRVMLFFLLSGFNLYNDFMLGQMYIAMLWLLLMGLHFYKRNELVKAGFLWALLASIKFLPLLFCLLFLYKKQYRMAAYLFSFFVFLQCIILLIVGLATYQAFLNSFYMNYLSGKVANVVPVSVQYQSMESIINLYFPSNSANGSAHLLLQYIWKLSWLGLFIAALLKVKQHQLWMDIAISSSILLLLLVEAGSASYHLLFALPPFLYLVQSRNGSIQKAAILNWALLGFLPTALAKLPFNFFILNYARLELLIIFSLLFFISLWSEKLKA